MTKDPEQHIQRLEAELAELKQSLAEQDKPKPRYRDGWGVPKAGELYYLVSQSWDTGLWDYSSYKNSNDIDVALPKTPEAAQAHCDHLNFLDFMAESGEAPADFKSQWVVDHLVGECFCYISSKVKYGFSSPCFASKQEAKDWYAKHKEAFIKAAKYHKGVV